MTDDTDVCAQEDDSKEWIENLEESELKIVPRAPCLCVATRPNAYHLTCRRRA
jgi:hypothetical protein